MEVENIFNEKTPSIIQNPFTKNGFDGLSIFVNKHLFNEGQFNISANVNFKNGNTKGKQEFTNSTLDGLLLEIKTFLDQLQ